MKKRLFTLIGALAIVAALCLAAPHPAAAAIDVFQSCSGGASGTAVCKATSDKLFGPGSVWSTILNTLVFVTGSISVLMIVIGGLRYTISAGDQSQVTAAKNTIMYAVVGLVLSLMGYAIVNFILSRI